MTPATCLACQQALPESSPVSPEGLCEACMKRTRNEAESSAAAFTPATSGMLREDPGGASEVEPSRSDLAESRQLTVNPYAGPLWKTVVILTLTVILFAFLGFATGRGKDNSVERLKSIRDAVSFGLVIAGLGLFFYWLHCLLRISETSAQEEMQFRLAIREQQRARRKKRSRPIEDAQDEEATMESAEPVQGQFRVERRGEGTNQRDVPETGLIDPESEPR